MKYDLTKPCADCPFRSDKRFPLNEGRVEDIVYGLYNNATFSCHKTTTAKGRSSDHKNAQHCAGALIFLENQDRPHQMMRICERLGMYDRRKLDMDFPVYDTMEEMIEGCDV